MPRGRPPKPGFEQREARAVELLKLGFKPTEVMKKIKAETQINMSYYRIVELAQEHGLHDGNFRPYTKRENPPEEPASAAVGHCFVSVPPPVPEGWTTPTSSVPAPLPQVKISKLEKAPSPLPEEIRADRAEVGKTYNFAHNPKFGGRFVEMVKGICYFDTGIDGSRVCIGRDETVIPSEG